MSHAIGEGANETSVFHIPDLSKIPDPVFSFEPLARSGQTIIIDNGSYECKAGWSGDDHPLMVFRCYSTKIRGQKGGDIYVGNDVANYETSGWMPMKSPFEKNVVTHPEIQEHIMDHIFAHLGFGAEQSRIGCPVVMTEPFCNPNYYRQFMSELLFECYDVPSVLYGVDALFGLEHNLPAAQNALVVGLGHAVSQVIPILNGQICFKHARRASYGGQNISTYLQRLLQLKHPHLAVAIGGMKAEYLTHTYCRFALNYEAEALQFVDGSYAVDNTIRIQLPFNSVQPATSATTTSGKMDVCHAIVQRVESVLSTRYKFRVMDSQEKLQQMLAVHDTITAEQDSRARAKAITELGFSSLDEVEASISALKRKIETILQCELPPEVDLCHYSDPDSWLMGLRRARENLKARLEEAEAKNLPAQPRGQAGALVSDAEMLDRVELIIFETEREFKRGCSSSIQTDNLKNSSGIAQFYQLRLGTERFRAPEVLFQPTAMLGIEQAGLIEMVERVLDQFSLENRLQLVENVFVTGGPATLPGLKDRLEQEIRGFLPFRSNFSVVISEQPSLAAWHGARKIACNSDMLRQFAVTKQDYDEFGPDYIKTYRCSNVYAPSPLVVRI